MNQVDLAALALALAFAYRGYRTGFVAVVLGLTGGLLAFGMAAALAPVLAPALAPFVTEPVGLPGFLLRPVLVVALTVVLRFLLGFAVRELTSVLRLLVGGVPPLALADRLLGILPAAALGGLLALAMVLLALALPRQLGVRDVAERSWIARTVISHPQRTLHGLRDLVERLLTETPRVNGYVLAVGVAGLVLATTAAGRVRGQAYAVSRQNAPTRRESRPPVAEAVDPFAWARAALGVGVALTMALGLLLVGNAR